MKIALIGCSRGIGRYLADTLCSEHEVLRVSRTVDTGCCIRADVTDFGQMLACATKSEENFNRFDALIYCAGTQGQIGPTLDADPVRWSQTIDTNVKGLVYSVLAFKDLLRESHSPRIIAFSGGGATKSRPNLSAYAASKAALVRFIETLADEQPDWHVNAVAPGCIVKTRMTQEIIEAGPGLAGLKEYTDAANAKEDPQILADILNTVTFLLSSESDGISGNLITAKWDKDVFRNRESYANGSYRLRRVEPVRAAKAAIDAKAA